MTFGHVAGLPLEETLATGGPALLAALAAVGARLRASLRRVRRTGDKEIPTPR